LFGLTPEEALAATTCHAAAALGLEDRGTLQADRRADFVLWDADDPAQLAWHIAGWRPRATYFEGKPRPEKDNGAAVAAPSFGPGPR
jgi:imidazolonepropionase